MSSLSYTIVHKDAHSGARAGKFTTSHGVVETPAFVPVGTQATVKSLTPEDLRRIGVQILFGNTYHLHLRPGEETVEEFGGLGKFMGFPGTTMTDSGGFQVFSLARTRMQVRGPQKRESRLLQSSETFRSLPLKVPSSLSEIRHQGSIAHSKQSIKSNFSSLQIEQHTLLDDDSPQLVKITEDGVEFKSHLDGSTHFFTPEQSIGIQKKLGADICLSFDDCAPFPITYEGAKAAMERTHRWAERSLTAFKQPHPRPLLKGEGDYVQALYGIVQGSVFEDLRKESATFIGSLPFDGFAIGGVSVGESKEDMVKAVEWSVPLLPEDRVKHLLGVGDVDDIFYAIERGIDTLDCVTPTRLGRVGHVFIPPPEGNLANRFRLDVTKSTFSNDHGPLTEGCDCYACTNFTRGYINHLFRAKEMLAGHLATYHNVYFMINLVKQIREAILNDQFISLKEQWLG